MRPETKLIALIGLPVVLLVIAFSHLFRSEVANNEALGKMTLRYRWGRAFEASVDSNRDGATDARYLVDGNWSEFSPHTGFSEFWEDRNHDGVFELHGYVNNHGARATVNRLDVDEDGDGAYDRTLEGPQEEAMYISLTEIERR